MAKSLVIVESPAKARTIARYLGDDFEVESSIGHIRDLPGTAAEIPAKYKKEPWARLGVNVDRKFEVLYIVPKAKKAQVAKLKELLKNAEALYLATDEDREGEAIAWHLGQVLKPKVPVKRMVFGEITESAISQAVNETRDIDERLVAAQEARRILDRLYGYEVSPVLWRKVRPRLSAGRVQSVATRLVVDRERARMRFVSAEYWDVEAELIAVEKSERAFGARLIEIEGQRVAAGRDFDEATGELSGQKDETKESGRSVLVVDRKLASLLAKEIESAGLEVAEVKEKPFTRRPYPPFITSTLQQEAGRKLRFSAQRAMQVAQGLYENGYITYMRTDSTQLSSQAVLAARSQIEQLYGGDYLPESARTYSSKSKNAQEAHEAIRPAGSSFRTPAEVSGELEGDGLRLYELIWKRTIASQMKDTRGVTTSVRIHADVALGGEGAGSSEQRQVVLAASGKVIRFAGFLRAYVEGSDDPDAELEDQEILLPALATGDELVAQKVEPREHRTQPPARFTEASLVKELEERGIGRPSTYASIIQTIQDRGYAWKKGTALVPTFTAFAVTKLLEQHLGGLVDFGFTARMEDDLDAIARGEREAQPWLHAFYFGTELDNPDEEASAGAVADAGLKELIGSGWEGIDARAVCSEPLGRDRNGEMIFVRVGRYGPYLQLGDDGVRATIRDDIPPEEMTVERASELLEKAALGDQVLGDDPETGAPIYVKTGRFGDYVQLGDPELNEKGQFKKGSKPKTASVWPSMDKEELTLEQALMLLSFPRQVGEHPESGESITAQDGPFGPYIKMGAESRSLKSHEQLATVTLEQAVELLKQPKGRRQASASVIAELGKDSRTELDLTIKTGRYGPYVTDGVVNASIPKGRDPETVTLEQGQELIVAREEKLRDQGKDPRAKKTAKKAKKAGKSAKKKAAKKSAKSAKKVKKKAKATATKGESPE